MRKLVAVLALLAFSAGSALAVDKLAPAHERQLTALNAVVQALRGSDPEAQPADIALSLGALAEIADAVTRDSLDPADNFTAGPLYVQGLQADFRRNNWPAPASMAAAFRWLQANIGRGTPQQRRAMITAATNAAEGMVAQFGPWATKRADQLGKRELAKIGLRDPNAPMDAKLAAHEHQIEEAWKARRVLEDANMWTPDRPSADIIAALDVLAVMADLVARDSSSRTDHSGAVLLADYTQRRMPDYQAAFTRQGWPEPATMAEAFRSLQRRLQQAPQQRKAIVRTAWEMAALLTDAHRTWVKSFRHWGEAWEAQANQQARKAALDQAIAESSYWERVWDRISGAGRFGPGGIIGLIVGWVTGIAIIWFLLVGGLARLGMPIFAVKLGQVVWHGGMWSTPAVALTMIFLDDGAVRNWVLGLGILGAFIWRAPSAWSSRQDGRKAIHGSARFSNAKEAAAAGRLAPQGEALAAFALGRVADPPRGCNARLWHLGHVLTCAPTGAGKGVSAAIPNLLTYPGSAFVLDFKGELVAVTGRAREAMGHEVVVIDPFRVTGYRGQSLNWFDAVDPRSPEAISVAASLAEMLVIASADGDGAHWEDTARDLLRGLILYVATLDDERRHFGEVRRLLTLPFEGEGETLLAVLADMAAHRGAAGVIARAANAFLGKPERERGSVLSTAQRHTAFLDDPRIVAALARSDISLHDLKTRPMTVYVCLPPHLVAQNSRFLRGLIGVALAGITSSEAQPDYPVLFLLDEFAQLGRMSAVEDAIAIVRGYGAYFWLMVQDLSQLRAVYPKWQTFLANAAQQFFGTADYETARYISDQLGQRTVKFSTQSLTPPQKGAFLPGITTAEQFTGRPLLTPDEVMATGATLVFLAGERPYALRPLNYLSDPEYRGLAEANPRYRQAG